MHKVDELFSPPAVPILSQIDALLPMFNVLFVKQKWEEKTTASGDGNGGFHSMRGLHENEANLRCHIGWKWVLLLRTVAASSKMILWQQPNLPYAQQHFSDPYLYYNEWPGKWWITVGISGQTYLPLARLYQAL